MCRAARPSWHWASRRPRGARAQGLAARAQERLGGAAGCLRELPSTRPRPCRERAAGAWPRSIGRSTRSHPALIPPSSRPQRLSMLLPLLLRLLL
eukprot:829-Prymnesium_polylepis.1